MWINSYLTKHFIGVQYRRNETGKHLMIFLLFFCQDETSTLFLIAGYARYSCPYVWIRSNHHRLVKLMGEVETEKDSPLRLKSTASWKDRSMTCCNPHLYFFRIWMLHNAAKVFSKQTNQFNKILKVYKKIIPVHDLW